MANETRRPSPSQAPTAQPFDLSRTAPKPAVPFTDPQTGTFDILGATASLPRSSDPEGEQFFPAAPADLQQAGLDIDIVEPILLRLMVGRGATSTRQIAREICLPQTLIGSLLDDLRKRTLVEHKGSTSMGDFLWALSDAGRNRAVEHRKLGLYTGPAPVPFDQYLLSVTRQSVHDSKPHRKDLERAFADLRISAELMSQIGPALASGKGMFIHGDAGNGKTSIAERITQAIGGEIWVPHTLLCDGVLINLFDPTVHEPVEQTLWSHDGKTKLDRRWVRIRRPTVIAGGELTLEMLDVRYNSLTGVCEAPLQLKGNCGTLVIDDFGRQIVEPNRLLNRWIIPLERGMDYLRMPNGRKLRVPFDVVLLFSSNLEPSQLVDEAFLRRIPYKIRIPDPSAQDLMHLLQRQSDELALVHAEPGLFSWLIENLYTAHQRPMRFCHPRDILLQVLNICRYEDRPLVLDRPTLERAARMYFTGR